MARVKTLVSINNPTSTALNDRRCLSVAVASVPNDDPTVATDGFGSLNTRYLHVYAKLTGGATAATVTVWYYSHIAEGWFAGESILFTASDTLALVQVEGEQRCYFVVDSLAPSGTIEIWAAGLEDG